MKALRKQGVEEICMKIFEDIYMENTAPIKQHEVSEKIQIQKTVRQGETIFHKLFTAFIEFFLRAWIGKRK